MKPGQVRRIRPASQPMLDFSAAAPTPSGPAPSAPPAQEREEAHVHRVGELTRRIRDLLHGGIGQVWVEGEISNMRKQSSGHCYFTLKDETAQLSCVLFARAASALRAGLSDGEQVELFGEVSVYEPRGQYQLIVSRMRGKGAGALHARFEALKRRLGEEGLFDPARKRPLPQFPSRIGVVTSPTGAAIRDFLDVLHRRHPGIAVVINPVRVQGAGAASEIARAVAEFGAAERFGLPVVDVVVVTRGGGSLEDLWEFNEEELARAVAASPVPVVSAVGHEIDFSICDFVADVRAPTPSAAAELLSADARETRLRVEREFERMCAAVGGRFEQVAARLKAAGSAGLLREARRKLEEAQQRLDRATEDARLAAGESAERVRVLLDRFDLRLDASSLRGLLAHAQTKADAAEGRIRAVTHKRLSETAARLNVLAAKLATLDPSATLARGYTITTDSNGRTLASVTAARTTGMLLTRFADGQVASTVETEAPM
jgi:exodeoxyribonuclease VII large subunit